ncbi:MAG: hypothetical protein LUE93_16945 [Bacteroides sp.]|nr:hypothetical protein [Bacteroides sp.]
MRRVKKVKRAKTHKELFDQALRAALRVDFINTMPELKLYTLSLYEAMKWGQEQTQ